MLRINRETDYAIRVILALSKYPPGEIIPSATIRKEMDLPESLSLQIISRLAHLNLINSFPGRKGGIQLAHPPEEITLHQVVSGMQGPVILSECLEEGHVCDLSPRCPVQKYWINLQEIVVRELQSANFKFLLEEYPHQSIVDVQ